MIKPAVSSSVMVTEAACTSRSEVEPRTSRVSSSSSRASFVGSTSTVAVPCCVVGGIFSMVVNGEKSCSCAVSPRSSSRTDVGVDRVLPWRVAVTWRCWGPPSSETMSSSTARVIPVVASSSVIDTRVPLTGSPGVRICAADCHLLGDFMDVVIHWNNGHRGNGAGLARPNS